MDRIRIRVTVGVIGGVYVDVMARKSIVKKYWYWYWQYFSQVDLLLTTLHASQASRAIHEASQAGLQGCCV